MRPALILLILSFAAPYAMAQDDPATIAMQQQQQAMQQAMQQAQDAATANSQQFQEQMEEAKEHAAQNAQPAVYYTAKPKFSLKPGKYGPPQTVKITDSSRGAVIYYTTDGWTPTKASNLYRGPVAIDATTTLQAVAIAPYLKRSLVTAAAYVIKSPAATQPAAAAANSAGAPGAFSASPNSSSASTGPAVLLPQGTLVPLVFVSDVNSKSASVGDPIQLALAEDLTVGNVLIAKKGSPATGVVTGVDKTTFGGFPGVLKFQVQSLNANGKVIQLVGKAKLEGEAKPPSAAPVMDALTVLRHGKDADIPPGTPFTAYAATATPLSPPSQ